MTNTLKMEESTTEECPEEDEEDDEEGESVFYPWEVDGYDSDETDT